MGNKVLRIGRLGSWMGYFPVPDPGGPKIRSQRPTGQMSSNLHQMNRRGFSGSESQGITSNGRGLGTLVAPGRFFRGQKWVRSGVDFPGFPGFPARFPGKRGQNGRNPASEGMSPYHIRVTGSLAVPEHQLATVADHFPH